MFERFTERARKVIVLAQEEAGRLRHDYIGTEHLLLGLVHEGAGVAAQALTASGVTLDGVRQQVETTVGYGKEPARAQMPFTQRAKNALEASLKEAMGMRHNYIGTEHLLLGLIREEDGVAARVLTDLGVHLDEAREQVESVVGYGEDATGAQAPFTPRTNKVLQLALREAMQLDHDYIGTEHVLLGLVRESEGVAARVLLNLGIDPDAVRREVIGRLPDARDDFDPFDEAERQMEEGEHRTLFRGRVGGIRATAAPLGGMTLEVDYSYRLWGDPAVTLATIDPEDVASVTRDHLNETRIDTLEGAVEVAGTHLMATFGPIVKITVSVTATPQPADPPAPTFSVSATFRR